MAEKRLLFQCHHCKETFDLFKDWQPNTEYLLYCPFCEEEICIEMEGEQIDRVDLFRGAPPDKWEEFERNVNDAILTKPVPEKEMESSETTTD